MVLVQLATIIAAAAAEKLRLLIPLIFIIRVFEVVLLLKAVAMLMASS